MRSSWTPLEAVLLAGVVSVGVALRWWHLDGPSLWWDEVIHVGTSAQASVWDVLRLVKLGSPPGSGNAGAVPLDYVLLHGWLRLVPMPEPRHLEAYFRLPAFAWSALTPLALHLWVRRQFDAATGLAAATCLALTTIHVAYAVEARFYALFCLMTVVDLAAFCWVLRSRRSLAWIVFAITSVLYFLSGLFALLVLAVEYCALGFDVLVRWWRRGRRPAAWRPVDAALLGGTAALVALAPALYYHGTRLALTARVRRAPIRPLDVTVDALWTYASTTPLVAALLALGVLLVVVRGLRGRMAGALATTLVALALGILPAIAIIERSKQYYFHPRHALFLTPVLALLVGVGAAACVGWMTGGRRRLGMVLAPLLVGALLAPRALAYVHRPESVLWMSKSRRQLEPLMEGLGTRLASVDPFGKVLLVAPLSGPAPLVNPVVARYLDWWGLADRVVFRGSAIPGTTLRRVRDVCGRSCRGRPGGVLEHQIGALQRPISLAPDARRMLGLGHPAGRWPGRVAGFVVLDYGDLRNVAQPLGFVETVETGLRTWSLPGDPLPVPSTPPRR